MDNFTVKTPDGSELIFSIRAIKEVQHANRSVDYRNLRDGFRWELLDPAAHCDDETLDECSEHIEYIVEDLVTNAATAAGKKLRILLGRAMHTLQDFYAHSNWVDERGLNKTTPNTDLGNYLKDYWRYGDLQDMDHNTANVLIADDDPAIHCNFGSALNVVWNELKYETNVTKDYGESVPSRKWPIYPISALHERFNPLNIAVCSIINYIIK
jgi:hypothetical protein